MFRDGVCARREVKEGGCQLVDATSAKVSHLQTAIFKIALS